MSEPTASAASTKATTPTTPAAGAPRRPDGRFGNPVPRQGMGLRKTLSLAWRMFTAKPKTTVPDRSLPVISLTAAELQAAPEASLWRLGHSTMLLKLDGRFWLTDPVFSTRASPFQWMGPARFHAPPIDIEDLPQLAGVILSHDHYDHLDHASILRLMPKAELFVAPLGVGDRLVAWGVDPGRVRQLDWWQDTQIGGLRLTAGPARHFSGRTLWDEDRTLWVSWIIETAGLRIFFSGDTGYHEGFKQIGERYGPFDLTLIENGAYNADWPEVHMRPEETLQAHLDLGGRWLAPIHNGTFDLAFHPWYEPFERIHALAQAAGVALATPMMGERLSLAQPQRGGAWWRQAMAAPLPTPAPEPAQKV